MRLALALCVLAAAGCADQGNGGDGGSSAVTWTGPGGSGGAGGEGGAGGAGAGGAAPGECFAAEGPGASGTDSWHDAPHTATVTIDDRASCDRSYTLGTDAPLRDGQPGNPRTVVERAGTPRLRSGHDMLDALYALALDEVAELSVDSITDGAFNGGNPIACPPGGCFETGRLWTYVWTRDTSYAVLLGLGLLDPVRARNSLEMKLSERRGGGDLQIVQDTGTGGSYPVSTDRATWAYGAWELYKVLDGAEREAFRDRAYEALANTAEHDRLVAFDAGDGLYRGEQSFLDWREQSYPGWTASDTVQIGMSKSLSTNVAHHRLLVTAAAFADQKGLDAPRDRYQAWADALASAIQALWLAEDGLFATYTTTALDPAPARRFDLLGSALVATSGIADASQRESIVASYPHLPKGAPVIWPQQKETPIYHNRAIWPFVTALWLRAAQRAENPVAAAHAMRSLIRGAALNLSNMENFEMVSGAPWVDDGAFSGPVVNSQRQLWSVAGFVSLVHDALFGLETSAAGIRFAPFIPADIRASLLGGAERIALSNLRFRGKRISVLVHLADGGDALTAASVTLDGQDQGLGFIAADDLADGSVIEVTLAPVTRPGAITEAGDAADYENLFGPRTPVITSLSENGGLLQLAIDTQGEDAAGIALDVYRDGALVASDLPGTTTLFSDAGSGAQTSESYCYSVEARFLSSGNRSQHARPVCWWGAGNARIATIPATSFQAVGGTLTMNHGRWHYEGWGDPGHTLTVPSFQPTFSGTHYVQLLAGNGAGPFNTGVTCGVKLIEVFDGATLVANGYAVMPHLGTWDDWRESSLIAVELDAAKSYRIVIREDGAAVNMSEREHFSLYGGSGGASGRFNRVNIAELKVLAAHLD
jgi:hypothetical protein